MIMIINTADEAKVFVGLVNDAKLVSAKRFLARHRQAEKLLVAIDKILKQNKVTLSDLTGVAVVTGPGPFTALRIGVVTANTLAWSLQCPVLGIKNDEFTNDRSLAKLVSEKMKHQQRGIVVPFYNKEPNITKKK
ncbi:MAG: tRNA (adenosine(37)-N6)-threonylcarbamoyltransferase complex dimerization subunit type 1 TsaB [Candidatus Buchananbacteria bacterium]|nr:tRNA (adenosine(37)-N6)-threonylcarbamoyltransferase complex dimerization subunit type 1 TsaB [Candidatus Buchananbacteria bacterium]